MGEFNYHNTRTLNRLSLVAAAGTTGSLLGHKFLLTNQADPWPAQVKVPQRDCYSNYQWAGPRDGFWRKCHVALIGNYFNACSRWRRRWIIHTQPHTRTHTPVPKAMLIAPLINERYCRRLDWVQSSIRFIEAFFKTLSPFDLIPIKASAT